MSNLSDYQYNDDYIHDREEAYSEQEAEGRALEAEVEAKAKAAKLKFRSWSETYKEMIQVSLIDFHNDYCQGPGIKTGKFLKQPKPIKKGVLMQFTGLEDIKRIEIYEGDIIYNSFIDREQNGVVEWSNIHHSYIIRYPYERPARQWHEMHGEEHCYEVIGNIFENPELLHRAPNP
jgi:uncharacterized phage protein (TIGR01671 family)